MKLCFLSSLLLFIFSAQGVPHKCIQKSSHTSDTYPTDTATCVVCPQVVPEEPTCAEGSIAQFQSQTCDECAKYNCVPNNETNTKPEYKDEIIPPPEEDCVFCTQAMPEEPICESGFKSLYHPDSCTECAKYTCVPSNETNPKPGDDEIIPPPEENCVICLQVEPEIPTCESGSLPKRHPQTCTECAKYTCVPSNETNPKPRDDEIIPPPEEDCPICEQAQPEEPTCASGFTATYRDKSCGCGGYVCVPETNPSDKECVICSDVEPRNSTCASGLTPQIHLQNCTHCATSTCEQSQYYR